ncbi:MAG: hypothetical protein ACP5XB_26065 [Isosphaeraceae bacterium]
MRRIAIDATLFIPLCTVIEYRGLEAPLSMYAIDRTIDLPSMPLIRLKAP